jgi:hypothetical protein
MLIAIETIDGYGPRPPRRKSAPPILRNANKFTNPNISGVFRAKMLAPVRVSPSKTAILAGCCRWVERRLAIPIIGAEMLDGCRCVCDAQHITKHIN